MTNAAGWAKTRRRLFELFGINVVLTIRKSPTLIKQLTLLEQTDILIKISRGKGTYYDLYERTIFLESTPGDCVQVSTEIAHEIVHAIIRPTRDPVDGCDEMDRWVDECMEQETDATVNECIVADELAAKGTVLPYSVEYWQEIWHAGGRAAIREEYESTVTSTNNQSYRSHYEGWYREIIGQ